MISVQALETINKLKKINGYVRLTLDKLPGIRADLVRLDNNWQEWDFAKLVDSLRRWANRNPKNILNNDQKHRREHRRCFSDKPPVFVFIVTKNVIKLVSVEGVKSVENCKLILSKKKLCFNCTRTKHKFSDCRSIKLCLT